MNVDTVDTVDTVDMYTSDYNEYRDEYNIALQQVLEEGRFIKGTQVQTLETKLADYVGTKYCITMNSGTSALLAALLAYNIGPGDKVITTPFTFIATAEVIALVGATPIFIDINYNTFNLDPTLLHKYLQSTTTTIKAIIIVDLYGQMADYTKINNIADKWNIPVIEDAAQSFGARMSCSATSIGCTSFYPTKPLGCYGDGGACFTNDDELAQRLIAIKQHGTTKPSQHTRIGLNARLGTIQAAILIVKLKYLNKSLEIRIRNAHKYNNAFKNLTWLNTPQIPPDNKHVIAQYTLRIHHNLRDNLKKYLHKIGIQSTIFYPKGLHLQPVFQNCLGSFPVTEQACAEVLSIPIVITPTEQNKVISAILSFTLQTKK